MLLRLVLALIVLAPPAGELLAQTRAPTGEAAERSAAEGAAVP